MPSGQQVRVRVDRTESESTGPRDVSLPHDVLTVLQVHGFTETVTGVVSSVKMALHQHQPDSVAVEFGIEINAKTGKVFSVLAEAAGKAHVKVTATWGSPPAPSSAPSTG